MTKSPITTHVLDTALGRPAVGVEVHLDQLTDHPDNWHHLASGVTNEDGRVMDLLPPGAPLRQGLYRLTFSTAPYLQMQQTGDHYGFYPYVTVVFEIHDSQQHYHVPLLLSPHGYSTYRGS